MARKGHRNALPLGYELHWYRIERVLGHGGFGLTYLAQDINLDRQVAIKEYMPSQVAVRDADNSIQPLSSEVEEDFTWGLKRFISEAKTLTQFEHPNLVRVINVFEANNSAYMVMSYVVGRSLRQVLRSGKKFTEQEIINLLFPLMDALETVHKAGFVHRDIKPGNVYIRDDGRPVLLDFGSARQTRGNFDAHTLTNFVSPGYAPIEQYSSKSDRQGPWTDIYGLGATTYETLTGEMPEPAIDRGVMLTGDSGDNFVGVRQRCKGRYSDKFLAAIDHAMAFNVQDRPQSIAEWRREFDVDPSQIENLTIPPTESVTLPARALRESKTQATVKLDKPTLAYTRDGDPPVEETRTVAAGAQTQEAPTQVATARHPGVPVRRRTSWVTTVGLVVLILLAGVGGVRYWPLIQQQIQQRFPGVVFPGTAPPLQREPVTTDPAPRGDEAEPALEQELPPLEEVVVTLEKRAPVPLPPPEPTREQRIEVLLRQAREDMQAMRLTTPASSNAYDKYQAVLSLDGDNVRAQRGLDSISDRYIQFFYTNLEADNLSRAKYYLDKAWQVTPGSPEVLVARKSLQTAVEEREAEQRRPQGIIDRVRGLFD